MYILCSILELSYRREKASASKIICYCTVRFIICNADSQSSGYYSTVESTFKSFVTTNTQPTYESINQFLETRSSDVIAKRPCNAQRQP